MLPTLPVGSFDVVIADPPYGIDYQSARRTDSERLPKIANDGRPFVAWLPVVSRLSSENGILLCFCRWDVQETFRQAISGAGYTIKAQIIWDRIAHGLGDLESQPAPQHDVIWFGCKGQFSFHGRRPKSVVRVMRVAPQHLVHPNEKPLLLMRHFVDHYVHPEATVLDPFMGSGVVGVACVQADRDFIGIEIDLDHFATACDRIRTTQRQAAQPALLGMEATS